MKFEKYHGIGNDYLVYDCIENKEVLSTRQIRKICSRNFGIGSDGVLMGPYTEDGEFGVRIFNPDGSEADGGGNGIRIFAKYLKDAGYTLSERLSLNTRGGKVNVRFLNQDGTRIQTDMGQISFDSRDVGMSGDKREAVDELLMFGGSEYLCTCASIGNPHCVILADEVSREKICKIGKYSEKSSYFSAGVNTQLMKVLDRNNIQIEIFERGAGYTLASGTSGCAAAGAAFRLGLTGSDVMVHMPGGRLWVQIDEDWQVKSTGNVQRICSIELSEEFKRAEF